MPTKQKKLTAGQRDLKRLANDVIAKACRLRNKAALVAGKQEEGRNLTALRNTAAEMLDLLHEILEPRCLVCGCTQSDCSGCIEKTGDACHWVGPGLCSACASKGEPS